MERAVCAPVEVRAGFANALLRFPARPLGGFPGRPTTTTVSVAIADVLVSDVASPQYFVVRLLDTAFPDVLSLKPLKLRSRFLTVASAGREALLMRRKISGVLLSLAQAYCSAGQLEKARAVAYEGLALLPPIYSGIPIPRARKLLELEAEMKRISR